MMRFGLRRLSVAVVTLVFCLSVPAEGGKLTLLKEGASEYRVILADDASAAEVYAVEELTNFIARATGVELPVAREDGTELSAAIYVGPTGFAGKNGIDCGKLGREEWVLQVVGRDLVIAGGRPRGTLYAVYEFLESQLGIRFLAMDATHIPKLTSLEVPQDLQVNGEPSFSRREMMRGRGLTFDVRVRINSFANAWRAIDARYGYSIKFGSPYTTHTHHRYVKDYPDKFDNPEFFAITEKGTRDTQVCMSHPEVRRSFVECLREYIKRDRAALLEAGETAGSFPEYYALVPDDGSGGKCFCERCMALNEKYSSYAGVVLEFTNEIAEEIEKDYPELILVTSAYSYYRDLPVGIAPRKNVLLKMAQLGAEFNTFPKRDTLRGMYHPLNKKVREEWEGWAEITPVIGVHDYWTPWRGNYSWPYVHIHGKAETIGFYHKCGMRHFFVEAALQSLGLYSFADLQYYVAARLLLDKTKAVDPLINEFAELYYGPAAEPMIALMEMIEQRQEEEKGYLVAVPPRERAYFDRRFFTDADMLLRKGEELAGDDEVLIARIRQERISFDVTLLNLWNALKVDSSWPFERAAVADRLVELHAEAQKKYGVRPIDASHMAYLRDIPAVPDRFKGRDVIDLCGPMLRLAKKHNRPVPEDRVADAEAVTGVAWRLGKYVWNEGRPAQHERAPEFGLLDQYSQPKLLKKRYLKPAEIPEDEGYHWYFAGRALGSSTLYFYAHHSWVLDHQLAATFNAALPDQRHYDIYVSLKLEGPAYVPGSQRENGFSIDRLILVEVDPNEPEGVLEGDKPLVMAAGGAACAKIILPTDAIPAEETAAQELAEGLEKITGAVFSIVKESDYAEDSTETAVFVGVTAAAQEIFGKEALAKLESDEFRIRAIGNRLYLTGGRPRGCLYAVYDLLEKDLGVRWLSYRKRDNDYYPRLRNLAIAPEERSGKPWFEVRDIHGLSGGGANQTKFKVRNKIQGPDLKRQEFGERETSSPNPLHPYGGTSHSYIQFPPDPWHGLRGENRVLFYIDSKEEFEKHPEHFCFDKKEGKRVPKQYCHSNPDVRRIVTEKILGRFAETGGQGIIMYSAFDSPGPFCECDDCMALIEREETPGGAFFDFLNELSVTLAETWPEAFVGTLAYRVEQSEIPPKNIHFGPNVIIRFAPVVASQIAPLDHISNMQHLENLRAWKDKADVIWVWYYPNVYFHPMVMGNLWRVHSDMQDFRAAGVKGFYIEQTTEGTRIALQPDIQTWIFAKLMDNPDRQLEELVEDFCKHYYGAAGELLKQYFLRLDDVTRAYADKCGEELSRRGLGCFQYYGFITAELLFELQDLLDKAEKLVADETLLLERVREIRLAVDFSALILWDRLGLEKVAGESRLAVADRFESRFSHNMNSISTVPAQYVKRMADFLAWQRVKKPLGNLPAPLSEIEPDRIRQLPPASGWMFPRWRSAPLVIDEAAAGGYAVCSKVGGQPFMAGYFDEIGRGQYGAKLDVDDVTGGEYRLYKLTETKLSEKGYIWFDTSWSVNFGEVLEMYNPDKPEQIWEIWASLKFEGPLYGNGDMEENRFFIDRLVFVAKEEAPEEVTSGTKQADEDQQPVFDVAVP